MPWIAATPFVLVYTVVICLEVEFRTAPTKKFLLPITLITVYQLVCHLSHRFPILIKCLQVRLDTQTQKAVRLIIFADAENLMVHIGK